MLLDDIMAGGVQFTLQGIQCSTDQGAYKVFDFIRQAILDRHIYVTKAIGVKFAHDVHAKVDVNNLVNIEGYYNCGESYPELMVKLSDKVFLCNTDITDVSVVCQAGIVTVPKAQFPFPVLYKDPYMLRVLSNTMSMELALCYNSGFKSTSYNSKITDKEMFPFYTDYSIADYVRVLPISYGDRLIPMRFRNGMTMDIFVQILQKWYAYINAGGVSKEEALWLQNSGH